LAISVLLIEYKDRRKMEKGGASKGSSYKFGQLFGYKGPNERIQ
jgi:hypothetical protein